MLRANTMLIAVLAGWLVGCTNGATPSSGGRSAPAELLQGIEINRIGQDRVGLREFQDQAMARSVAFAMGRGVARQRITHITVDTTGGEARRSRSIAARRTPVRFTVWLRIEGCESNIVFNASATGQIGAPRDSSGCLSASEQPSQAVSNSLWAGLVQ